MRLGDLYITARSETRPTDSEIFCVGRSWSQLKIIDNLSRHTKVLGEGL